MAGRVPPRQLAFALPHSESLGRDNFLEGPANAAGLALIDSWPEWPNRTMLLVGPEGSGKSHLSAIWAEQAGARATTARALTAANVPGSLATGALVVEDLKPAAFDERAPVITGGHNAVVLELDQRFLNGDAAHSQTVRDLIAVDAVAAA